MNPLKYEFGPFQIDTSERVLLRDGEPITLTPKTYETLLILVRNAGRVVEKQELMDALWPDTAVEENNLNQQISAVRKILGERAEEARYVKTIPGRGYKFVAEVNRPDDSRRPKRPPLHLLLLAAIAVLVLITFLLARAHRRPPIHSIAVLPFKSLSPRGDEYLGLGLTDVLITHLSNARGIIVRPTSAIRRYEREQDPLAAGRALHVESVLDGTIQHAGDRVRVTVRLLNVDDGAPIWGETFDEQFVDFFSVEDAISKRLADALALRLSRADLQLLTRRDTTNLEAHQAYLKGRYYSSQWTLDGFKKSRANFERAIDLDPGYAEAYVGLADAYYVAATIHVAPQEAVPRARALAAKALQLDDSLASAHATLGLIKFRYDWDFDGAEREFQRAIRLNSQDVTAHQWYSELLTASGRVEQSIAEAKAAQAIDPVAPDVAWNVGFALLFGGRTREAIEQLKSAVDLNPQFWLTHSFLGWAYTEASEYEQALKEIDTSLKLDDNADTRTQLVWLYAKSGRRADAQRTLDEMLERSRTTYVSPFYIAAGYASLGDNDHAFEWLRKACAEHAELLVFVNVAPNFATVRRDPRYDARKRVPCG
jgi:DNA-binding winged helix-turn-helix (wHTH) protein/TolB-like protein/Tfp pilus assembly protein PilF